MSAVADLSEEERYLYAILQDQSGIDQAEFTWVDETSPDFVFRCYDYQYAWYRDNSKFQIDQCARAIGKSVGMQMRAWAFPFTNPGEEMLLTAPEMIHLDPVTKLVEDRITSIRMSREFLKASGTSKGITHRPFEARFRNGSRIVGRIPQKDGKGVKGSCASPSMLSANTCYDDSMILTDRGLVPGAEIQVGDLVLTHRNRFRPVVRIHRYEADGGFEVAGAGHRGMLVSRNHRFYARRNSNPQRTRNLGVPTWVIADDEELSKRWYWASPIRFPSVDLADLDLPTPTRRCGPSEEHLARPGGFIDTPLTREALPILMALAGRYLADGHLVLQETTRKYGSNESRPSAIGFTDDEKGVIEVEALATLLGYAPRRGKHDHAFATFVYGRDFAAWMEAHFGRLSDGKRIPGWVLGAPEDLRRALLDGYLAGDGHWNQDKGRWEIGSASKALAIGIKLLGQTLGYSTSFSWVDPKVKQIAGTDLKKEPKRSYRVQLNETGHGLIEDGMLWSKIRKVTPVDGQVEVIDLVVAEDFSYVADGLVHKGSSELEGWD